MDANTKFRSLLAGVVASFGISLLFKFGISRGAGTAIALCAISTIVCLALLQTTEPKLTEDEKLRRFFLAIVVAAMFGATFMSAIWVLLYLMATAMITCFVVAAWE